MTVTVKKNSSFKHVLHTLIGPVWEFLGSIFPAKKHPPIQSRLVIYASKPVWGIENEICPADRGCGKVIITKKGKYRVVKVWTGRGCVWHFE